jgi:hypothetical protein
MELKQASWPAVTDPIELPSVAAIASRPALVAQRLHDRQRLAARLGRSNTHQTPAVAKESQPQDDRGIRQSS